MERPDGRSGLSSTAAGHCRGPLYLLEIAFFNSILNPMVSHGYCCFGAFDFGGTIREVTGGAVIVGNECWLLWMPARGLAEFGGRR